MTRQDSEIYVMPFFKWLLIIWNMVIYGTIVFEIITGKAVWWVCFVFPGVVFGTIGTINWILGFKWRARNDRKKLKRLQDLVEKEDDR